jgi:hypothetical protein
MNDDQAESISFFLLFNFIIGTNLHTVFTTLGKSEEIGDDHRRSQSLRQQLRRVFVQLNIQPLLFCFAWASLLFAQTLRTLALQDLLHFWDHLLIFNDKIVDFLMMLSAAYLLFRKKALMGRDYDSGLSDLHNPLEMNFMTMLRIAHQLWDQMKADEAA